MYRLQTEYVLKGIYLGLLLFVALYEPSWQALGLSALVLAGGLALCLAVGGYRKAREGYRVQGRLLPFLLFLFLESPWLVYAGALLGLAAAAFLVRTPQTDRWLATFALGGALLGLVFWLLRYVRRRDVRLGVSVVLAAGLVTAVLFGFGKFGDFGEQFRLQNPLDTVLFGTQLLLGVPFFYLLTFAGREEETEVEFGALCAALGLGVGMLTPPHSAGQSAAYLVPVVLYFWYTMRVLPRLRVFKHAIRGLSYLQAGRHRQALQAFRRALQLNPRDGLAREGLWAVHRALDLTQLPNDPEMLALVDLDMCLERAGSLLMQPPTPDKLQEAQRLLDLVLNQRPGLRATVHYWRSVAYTHAHRYDEAAAELERVLDPAGYAPDDAPRRAVLLQAWQLALRSRPELAAQVGTPQLAVPGRRLEAIAAVERHLAGNPEDADVWGFKRVLYQDLTEAEYRAAVPEQGAAADFDHGYVHQLGLALINDPTRWRRGAEYLRLAARGLPAQGPSIFAYVAQAHQREGDGAGAWGGYEMAKHYGRTVGPRNLGEEDRQAYFAAVKLLGDAALAHNRTELAIENYQLYTEAPRSGLETLRTLTDLYERKGEPLSALRVTEQALLYNAKDKDLLERKDRYCWSVMPDDLRGALESVRGWFDVGYCLKKARALLDAKNWDLETLDWAQHLAQLARVVKSDSLAAKLLVARALLRRGEKEQAATLLQEIHAPKPERFATTEDEEAWYLGCKLLGELYLYDLGKPDLAVECFKSFRESSKSGADTMYKLGQAYEQLGDRVRAVKFYKHVVTYDQHPLAPEAQDALHRLQAT